MMRLALLLVFISVNANVFADAPTVNSVSLHEPPKSTSINSANARVTPNQWKLLPCLTCPDVVDIQIHLIRLGYKPSGVDGIIGPITMAAIKAFQNDKQLTPNGQATDALLDQLKSTN